MGICMNWYKKSKKYLDVGHENDSILWYSPNGINIVKAKQEDFLSHGSWRRIKNVKMQYTGRYDTASQELSVVASGYRDVPQGLINNLLRSFPDTKTVYVFHEFMGEAEVIKVANSKLKELKEPKEQKKPKMSKEELEQYEFPAAEWGHSITPKKAFEKRKNKDFDTLYDLSQYPDQWNFLNALGKGWEGHWENTRPSLHLIDKIKQNQPITIYRASDTGGILPGAYVTESKEYAIFHGQTSMNGKYKIYQLNVYPDELMSYGDAHEFIYIPRNLDIAHERMLK